MTDDLPCQQLVELVTAYLEDALDTGTRTRFEEHIAACAGCATYLDQFRETIALLGTLEVSGLSADSLATMRGAFRDWAR